MKRRLLLNRERDSTLLPDNSFVTAELVREGGIDVFLFEFYTKNNLISTNLLFYGFKPSDLERQCMAGGGESTYWLVDTFFGTREAVKSI